MSYYTVPTIGPQSNQSTGQPSWQSLNQSSKLDSHPGCRSIKPVNWTAILAATQSNQQTGQPSWLSLNQTSKLDSHPGCHSIKPVSESWRPIGRLKGGVWGGGSPPRKNQMTAAAASQQLSPSGWALGVSRPGTKYPVRGIPHFHKFRHPQYRLA